MEGCGEVAHARCTIPLARAHAPSSPGSLAAGSANSSLASWTCHGDKAASMLVETDLQERDALEGKAPHVYGRAGNPTHHIKDLAFAYRALPAADLPPMATKPVPPSALRAALTASAHFLAPLVAYRFFEAAEAFFETILPALFFFSASFVRPDMVFSFLPDKTEARARFPLATLLTFFAFITRFIAFIAPAFFMPAFMAAFFMAAFFMGSAIAAMKAMKRVMKAKKV